MREVAVGEPTHTGSGVTEVGRYSSHSPPPSSLALNRAGYPCPTA